MFNLEEFSKTNLKRCESSEGFNHALNSWEYEQWTNAIAGEAGEACNVAKKLLRHRQQTAGNKGADLDPEFLKQKLAKELADVIIYADLAIQRLRLSTSDVVRNVFNLKSEELGCSIKFEE